MTESWQSVCDRYADDIDDVIDACRNDRPDDRLLTVIIKEDDCIKAGPRASMDEELRGYGQHNLADHINACEDVPDGRVVSAIAHIVVLTKDPTEPVLVGTMPVYAVNSLGGGQA